MAKSIHELKLNAKLEPVLTNSGKKAAPQREAACHILSQLFQQCPGSAVLMLPSFDNLMMVCLKCFENYLDNVEQLVASINRGGIETIMQARTSAHPLRADCVCDV